jgi:hypothetical protein
MDETTQRRLLALNTVNQQIYKELLPQLSDAQYYHSEIEFWNHVPGPTGRVFIRKTKIYTYGFQPLDCPDMSTRIMEPHCQAILERQQVMLGKIAQDLMENSAKITDAISSAIAKGKLFSLQSPPSQEPYQGRQRRFCTIPEVNMEGEEARKLFDKLALDDIPLVCIQKFRTKWDVFIDQFDNIPQPAYDYSVRRVTLPGTPNPYYHGFSSYNSSYNKSILQWGVLE